MIAVAYDTEEDIDVLSKYDLSTFHLYVTGNYLGKCRDAFFLHDGYCSSDTMRPKGLKIRLRHDTKIV